MSEQRRGPEYVPAHIILKKREKIRRNFSWLLIPVVGIGLAYFVTSVVLPQQRSGDQYSRLRRSLRGVGEFHSIEFRPTGDRETVLREDWVTRGRRRLEYYGGQFVILHFSQDGTSEDLIYEPAARSVRRHQGAVLAGTAPERLMNDMSDREVKSYGGPDGELVIETRRRKHLVVTDPKNGRPLTWKTYYFTDQGEELLSRTEMDYGDFDRSKLEVDPEIKAAKKINFDDLPNRYSSDAPPIASLGNKESPFHIQTLDINAMGDVFYIYRSPFERPFIEVTANGLPYSPMDMFTGNRDENGYLGEQLAIRLTDPQLTWPLTVKITVRSDPRFESGSASGKVLGTFSRTFDHPTCFMAPAQWFGTYVADGPLYDYQRTRHFRLAQVFQNMMRGPDGHMVDTMAGGAAALEQTKDIKKNPVDLQSAVFHARTVLRVRAEYDAGRLSMARVYVLLAELHLALGERDLARQAIAFAQGMVREGRADAFTASEIERAAKELGL